MCWKFIKKGGERNIAEYVKKKITYHEYEQLLNSLVYQIKKSYHIKDTTNIYGIERGGLPIAIHLSHFLDIKYSGGFSELIKQKDIIPEGNKIMIVDDICDTGKTFDDLKFICDKVDCYFVSLFLKPRSIFIPDYYVKNINNSTWVVFPWEKIEEETNR